MAMACMPDKQTENDIRKDESLQEIASKLPEGDALPDGFSDCPTELDSSRRPLQPSKVDSPGVSCDSSMTYPDGPISIFGTSNDSFGASVVSTDTNDVSSPSLASPNSKRERSRSFPVQLSSAESLEENYIDERKNQIEDYSTSDKSDLFVITEVVGHNKNSSDEKVLIEVRDARTWDARTDKVSDTNDQDASPEIDQLIHATALSDNGIQTVEGLHSSLLEDEIADLRKQKEQLINENSILNAQLAKSKLVREKLESLCRELQRHNKQLTDECKRIASEEQQKRLELSNRFHEAIKDVTVKLEEQGDERLRQAKQNELLQEKLRQFTQQYELQEQQYSQHLKAKSLDYQILEVKLKQQEEINKQGEAKLFGLTEHITQLLQTEQEQKARIALYGEKFEQFQEMLSKSNEVFASFKTQMEKMSKTIKNLEKENLALKRKCEKSDVSLIELVDERAQLRKQLETTSNQKERLEALCRTMQAERKQQNVAMASVPGSTAASDSINAPTVVEAEQVE